jgi:radical SAM superfamily enzyme YgiQ (UPF0313 family)
MRDFRIAFIYPAYESLGIEYLSSCLKGKGFDTRLFFDPVLFAEEGFLKNSTLARIFSYRRHVLDEIVKYNPALLCFSVTTDNFEWATSWAERIKKRLAVPIIFGGIHPTSAPEEVLANPYVDFICIGEGEEAVLELAESLFQNKGSRQIRNIWQKNEDRTVTRNDVRPLIQNLDEIPLADKDLFYSSSKASKKGYAIITSRGCPNNCSFCCNSILREIYGANNGRFVRRRSIENVIRELEIAQKRYKPNYVLFFDEVFTCEKNWLREFISEYNKHIGLPFSCYLAPNFVDEEIVSLLKRGKCFKVQMGIQTLDEEKRRRLLNRHDSNEHIKAIIESFKKNRIYITCDNIFGLPGQSRDELIQMAEFYTANKPDNIEIFWLKYYPKTRIKAIALKSGFLKDKIKDAVDQREQSRGIAAGGDTYKKEFSRFQFLFNIFFFCPYKVRKFFLKIKLYKFLPAIKPEFNIIIFRLFNRAKFDLQFSRTLERYRFFSMKVFLDNIHSFLCKKKRY